MDTLTMNSVDQSNYLDAKNMVDYPNNYTGEQKKLMEEFKDFILQKGYPCVGAQTAVNGNTVALGKFESIDEESSISVLSEGLHSYLQNMYR